MRRLYFQPTPSFSPQGALDENTLNVLRLSEDVEYITEDGIMHTMATQCVF
jgi:hypothetical protein